MIIVYMMVSPFIVFLEKSIDKDNTHCVYVFNIHCVYIIFGFTLENCLTGFGENPGSMKKPPIPAGTEGF
jgi:hypothetical protein